LYFQLYTHAELFDEAQDDDDDEELQEEPMLTTTAATMLLASISVLVAVHSEYLTGSIEEVSADTGMSQVRKCGV
jgi:calcium/proton exchanger cax